MANNALWLEGWTVGALDRQEHQTIAEAAYDTDTRDCPKCGCVGRLYKHGKKVVNYRDIPTFGKPLVIRTEVTRYKCRECGETSMQELPAMDSSRRMTKRLIDYIVEQGIEQTYSAVARHVDVNEKTVRNICDEHVRMAVGANLQEPPIILGIDELTIRKRKRTVFVDVANRRLIDMIDSMAKPTVTHWLSWMPGRERVRIVTIDMWGPYADVARELLPNAIIVTDKWHIVSKANERLDQLRSRFRRGAKGKMKRNPHRGRLLMHTRPKKLSPMRRMMLDGMLENNPLLKDGWTAKEGFYAIWEATDRTDAERRFDEWKAAIPDTVRLEFDPLAATVENWREEVFNYFDHPFTNAYTEARNRLVKDFNRAGRGYSFDRIRAKALLQKPITSKPLMLCENCLGVFDRSVFLTAHHIRPAKVAAIERPLMLCASCHRKFHTEEGLSHEVNSTSKSE